MGCAGDGDITAHEAGIVAAEAETEARATGVARVAGSVGLAKRLEESGELLGREPDAGVSDVDSEEV